MKKLICHFEDFEGDREETQLLINFLQTHDLFSPAYLYTVVDGGKSEKLLKKGTYRWGDILFAFNFSELKEQAKHEDSDRWQTYARYLSPALAVYNADCFNEHLSNAYQFKNPTKKKQALEAIILLHYSL